MAKSFLTNLNMNQNEIQNAVIQPLATAPSNAVIGQVYYNSGDKKLYQYNGSTWVVVGDGDMKKSVYDTDGDGVVDKAEDANTVNGKTVLSNVPADAKFTDTVYTHPTSAGNKHIPSGGASDQILGYGDSSGTAKWLTPTKSLVGLGNVDNTADVDKPISTAVQNALNAKAPLASPTFTGTPKAPTAAAGTNTTQIATTAFVKTALDNAIASLPADQFLDMNKTKYVDSFAWSSTTYPGSTNPSLEGKPVLVLALTDGTNVTYSFVSLNDLVDVYTGTAPITVSGGKVSHNDSGVTPGSYGQSISGNITAGRGLQIPYITFDEKGHAIAATNRTVYLEVGKGRASIPAGETSVTVDTQGSARIAGYCAYMNGEEVVVDLSHDSAYVYTFSIAQAQESNISIVYDSYDWK